MPGGQQGVWNPQKNHKNIGFLSNAGPDPLKNLKATKPEYNVGQSSVAVRWRADDGPLLMLQVFGSSLPSQKTKNK